MANAPNFIYRALVSQLWTVANIKQAQLNAIRKHKDYCLPWFPSCDLRNDRFHDSFAQQSLQYRSCGMSILQILKRMKVPHYNRAIAFRIIMETM